MYVLAWSSQCLLKGPMHGSPTRDSPTSHARHVLASKPHYVRSVEGPSQFGQKNYSSAKRDIQPARLRSVEGPSQHWGHNDLGRRPGQRHTGVAQSFVSTRPGSWAPPGVSSKTMNRMGSLLPGQSSGKRNVSHLTGGHDLIATTMSPTARGTSAIPLAATTCLPLP